MTIGTRHKNARRILLKALTVCKKAYGSEKEYTSISQEKGEIHEK
ncbi:hypothetical protein [Sulfurovum sp.]|nr:hypothetical protein [Sulfurovum sp.]